MKDIGLARCPPSVSRIFKNKLGEYVRLAAAGENVLVTDRDGIVAQLGPPPPQRAEMASDALLAQAVREGLIIPAALPPGAPPPAPPAGVMTLAEFPADLAQPREDR